MTATCFNGSQFEDAACCAEAGLFEAYTAATTCPQRVELSKPEGNASMQRCRNAESGQFVDSACCSDICDGDATRNSNGQCVNSAGQFEDSMCCFLAASLTAKRCEGAAWTTVTIGGEERDACRGDNGRFAMNSCCAAECVDAVSEGELSSQSIPEACASKIDSLTAEAECPDESRENSAGICHNPGNGQFVKAACCEARGRVAVTCGFGRTPKFGTFPGDTGREGESIDPSHQLEDAIGRGFETVEESDLGTDELLLKQIQAALLHEGFLLPGEEDDRARLIDVTDDNAFFVVTGTVNDVEMTWIQWFSGDTEVGAVFDAGTTDLIASIGDGDIQGCGPE